MLFVGLVVTGSMALRPTPMPVLPVSQVKPVEIAAPMKLVMPSELIPLPGMGTPVVGVPSIAPLTIAIERINQIGDAAPMKVSATLGSFWDGENENAGAEENAYVRKEEKKQEAVRHMHAEIPPLDQRRSFSEPAAEEFAEGEWDLGGKVLTGKQILQLLVTPYAVVDGMAPDPAAVDFAGFGRGEDELREIAEREGFSYHRLSQVLKVAHRDGLIYRLFDKHTSRTFYGVSYDARQTLKLSAAAETAAEAKKTGEAAAPSAFGILLSELKTKAKALPPGEELVEFTQEIVDAHEGDRSRLNNAVLSLVESADGTPWFGDAVALAEAGVEEGFVDAAELEQILRDLR